MGAFKKYKIMGWGSPRYFGKFRVKMSNFEREYLSPQGVFFGGGGNFAIVGCAIHSRVYLPNLNEVGHSLNFWRLFCNFPATKNFTGTILKILSSFFVQNFCTDRVNILFCSERKKTGSFSLNFGIWPPRSEPLFWRITKKIA